MKSSVRTPQKPSSSSGRTNKSFKIQQILGFLQESRQGLTLDQLAQRLGVSERTATRYLAELRNWGYPLETQSTGAGRTLTYSLAREEALTAQDFIPSLRKIKDELYAGGNPKYSHIISRLVDYLDNAGETQTEPSDNYSSVYYVDHGPFAEAHPNPGVLRILEKAIISNTAVKLRYSSYSDRTRERLFFPYCLSLRVGTLYVIGREEENQGPFKSLLVKRILRCIATNRSFRKAEFNIREYYRHCFGQWARQPEEKPERVVLEMAPGSWLIKYLSESHFNPEGRFFDRDGHTFFEMEVVIKPDFVSWVQSHLPDLVPVEPEHLCTRIRDRMEKGLELFDKEKS